MIWQYFTALYWDQCTNLPDFAQINLVVLVSSCERFCPPLASINLRHQLKVTTTMEVFELIFRCTSRIIDKAIWRCNQPKMENKIYDQTKLCVNINTLQLTPFCCLHYFMYWEVHVMTFSWPSPYWVISLPLNMLYSMLRIVDDATDDAILILLSTFQIPHAVSSYWSCIARSSNCLEHATLTTTLVW